MNRLRRLLTAGLALCSTTAAAEVNDALIQSGKPTRTLADYRLFQDEAAQRPAPGVHPFAPVTPLFSDYTVKQRFVYLPEGKAAEYHPDEAFAFPTGSVLVKSFGYPADFRVPGEPMRLIETRLLIRTADGWQAWAYLWDEAQTEARLTVAGARVPVSFVDAQGRERSVDYRVPNKNQCKGCHELAGEIVPLGPKARNLNAAYEYPEGRMNQLAYWMAHGLLDGAPAPAEAPAMPDWTQETASVEERVRAYLDINCAHCHRLEGPASNSGLFLGFDETDRRALGVGKRPVAAGRGSGGHAFNIVPGDPVNSIMVFRMESSDPGTMMPELGRSLVHEEAVELIIEWIKKMDAP